AQERFLPGTVRRQDKKFIFHKLRYDMSAVRVSLIYTGEGNAGFFKILYQLFRKIYFGASAVGSVIRADLLRGKVFRRYPQDGSFEPQHKILCDQDNRIVSSGAFGKALTDLQDTVIRFFFRQIRGKSDVNKIFFNSQ